MSQRISSRRAAALRWAALLAPIVCAIGCSRPHSIALNETPLELTVGYAMACARGAAHVQCWDSTKKSIGDRKAQGARVLSGFAGAPKRVVIGSDQACVLDDLGTVACVSSYAISYSAALETSHIKDLRAPVADIIGVADGVCALEAGGSIACFTSSKPPMRARFVTNASAILATVDHHAFCARHAPLAPLSSGTARPNDFEYRCGRYFSWGSETKLEGTWRVRGLSAPSQIDADDRYFAAIDEGRLKTVARDVLRPVPVANSITGLVDLETATEDVTIGQASAIARDSIWRRALSNGAVRNVDSHFQHGVPWPLDKGRVAEALWTGPQSHFYVKHGDELWDYGWQKGKRLANKVSGVKNPTYVGFNLYEACVLYEGGAVSCWPIPK